MSKARDAGYARHCVQSKYRFEVCIGGMKADGSYMDLDVHSVLPPSNASQYAEGNCIAHQPSLSRAHKSFNLFNIEHVALDNAESAFAQLATDTKDHDCSWSILRLSPAITSITRWKAGLRTATGCAMLFLYSEFP